MPELEQYQKAARRILDEHRHTEGTTSAQRCRDMNPEMAEAVAELVALADEDFPLRPLPGTAGSGGQAAA